MLTGQKEKGFSNKPEFAPWGPHRREVIPKSCPLTRKLAFKYARTHAIQ